MRSKTPENGTWEYLKEEGKRLNREGYWDREVSEYDAIVFNWSLNLAIKIIKFFKRRERK